MMHGQQNVKHQRYDTEYNNLRFVINLTETLRVSYKFL